MTAKPRTTRARLERPSWLRHGLGLAPAWIAALVVYRNALGVFFTPDDVVSLSSAAGIEAVPSVFRPLASGAAFRIEYALFGLGPLGYHAVNLALHLVNAAGVYALALSFSGRAGLAQAAALLFAVSGIAFTPLHWASGIGDLLACALLLAATLLHWRSRASDRAAPRWVAAALAFVAVLSKETACAWPLFIAALELRAVPRTGGAPHARARALTPAAVTAIASFLWIGFSRGENAVDPAGPYALTLDAGHLARNLLTYLRWCADLSDPIRDRVAAPDASIGSAGLIVALGIAAALWALRGERPRTFEAGVAWLLAFLLPALPLAHHTYLYYLYIPWAGGAIALAALGSWLPAPLPRRAFAVVALAGFALIEWRNVGLRERTTFDALPVDRTMREAMLLGNAIPALWAATLPTGARVGFVNPLPRPGIDVTTGAPTRSEDRSQRVSYYPLEAVMLNGRTLRLFLPGIGYAGFAARIPPAWGDVDCFLFEQRGYLRHWGKGRDALEQEAEYVARMGGVAADSAASPPTIP